MFELKVAEPEYLEDITNNCNPFGEVKFREDIIDYHNFCYGHFKVGDGFATVAGGRIGNNVYYGISFCSPKDNFSKQKGRILAEDHLIDENSAKLRGVYKTLNLEVKSPSVVFKEIVERFIGSKRNLPYWLRGNPTVLFQSKFKERNFNNELPYSKELVASDEN